jgi:hypothetical protein
LDGSSKKAYFDIKKNHSEEFLEKEGILESIESFFISEIDFYRELKKFCNKYKPELARFKEYSLILNPLNGVLNCGSINSLFFFH